MKELISFADLPVSYFNDTENMLMQTTFERAERIIKKFQNSEGHLKTFPSIAVFIEKESSINGRAWAIDDKAYGISVTYGAILIISDLFLRMLSYKHILQDIGNPSLEIHERPTLSDLVSDVNSLINFDGDFQEDKFNWTIPKDQTRYNFAQFTIGKAIDFLILHELHHILHGHVDWLGNKTGSAALAEDFNSLVYDKELRLMKKSLEMDADSCACCCMIQDNFSDAHSMIEILAAPQELRPFSKNANNSMAYTLFAIYAVFRASACKNYDENNLDLYVHPTPRQRQLYIMATAIRFIKERLIPKAGIDADLIDIEQIQKTMLIMTRDCESSYSLMTGLLPDTTKFPFSFKPTDLILVLKQNWNNLHKELVKYAFTKIPEIESATEGKPGRNDPCYCGSGKKFKRCHGF